MVLTMMGWEEISKKSTNWFRLSRTLLSLYLKFSALSKVLITILVYIIVLPASAQYYIRGDVKDMNGSALQNVKIYRPSTRSIYHSGISGGFGIPSSDQYDSLEFSKLGYQPVNIRIRTEEYQHIQMMPMDAPASIQKNKRVSLTTGKDGLFNPITFYLGETYSNLVENDFIKTDAHSTTSFSMRIDKASYSNIRRFLTRNAEVPTDAVRIDEMLNYFNLNYQQPDSGKTFRIESKVTDCPWNPVHRLLLLNVSAQKLQLDHVPPTNFVFLIDVSGSMDMPNRLPLLQEAFQLLVKNLRKQDTVSIVVYGGSVGIWLQPTSGAEKEKINQSIEELTASGDTPGEAAIRTAYQLARSTYIKNGNNRIILATDGDFNIGSTSEKDLEKLIIKQRESGVYLTCLGVGMGNYKDSKIETLAKKGNGNFAYIDDIREAEKVLVTQFTQTVYSIAGDVSISIKLNPDAISEYRLIGYDNRKSVLEENGKELEGGEIGSGAGNTIVFEIEPKQQDSLLNGQLANLTLNYKGRESTDTSMHQLTYTCPNNYIPFAQLDSQSRFAVAVTLFGLKLKKSKFLPETNWDTIYQLAQNSKKKGDYLQNQMAELILKAKSIYDDKRKRRKRK